MNMDLKEILFGKEPGAGRRIYLDILRFLATVSVICVHTVNLARSAYCPGTLTFELLEFHSWLFTLSNLLFFMISGALLLPIQGESAGTFFRKRFAKILLPMVVYYLIYIVAKQGPSSLLPGNWPRLLQRILLGPSLEVPHFWLIYALIRLYVLTPFLRYLLQNIPDSVMNGVMAVLLFIAAFDTYAPFFSLSSPFSAITDSFVVIFVFGYYLAERSSRRARLLTLFAGVCSLAVTVAVIFTQGGYDNYIYNSAPTAIFAAGAVMAAVKWLARSRTTESLCTRLIAKYSYSILMIHWGVLHVAVKKILHVDATSGGIVGGCTAMVLLTFVLSVLGAVIVDNTVVRAVRFILSGTGRGAARVISLHRKKS